MVLAERAEQLASLDRLLSRCRAGDGRLVLAKSAVAHGKTALLRTFVRAAAEAGALCLQATCSEFESAFPLGVLSQLFPDALPRNLVPTEYPESAMPPLFHQLHRTLLDLAEKRPVVLGIDDVHFADVVSLRFLLYSARRTRSTRILMVCTEAARLRPDHSALHAELGELPHAHRIHLPPLSETAVAHLSEVTTDLHAATGGNPALVRALLEEHGTPGRDYRDAVVSCLHRFENEVVTVARGLAVLGADASAARLSAMSGLDAEMVERALELLAQAGLLTGRFFRHPAVQRAVLDELSPPERADSHRRAAGLLHDQGAPALAVARHLVLAGHPAAPWAVDILTEAADLALVADDVTLAVDCLALAHRELPDGPGRLAVRAKLARAEWQLNPSITLRHFESLLAGVRAGLLSPTDAIGTARQMLWHGRMAQAAEILNWVRDCGGDTTELRDAELWMTADYPALGRGRQVPRDRLGEQNIRGSLGTDPWLRSTTALTEVLTRGNHEEAVARAERFLRETRLSHATPWSDEPALLALLTFVYTDRIHAAEGECARLLTEAANRGALTWQAGFSAVRAEIALRQGDFRTAAEQATAAMTHVSGEAWGVAVGFPLGSLILASTRGGDFGKAAGLLDRRVPEVLLQSRHGLHYLHARGQYHLATDRHHAALADFLSCGELMRGWGIDMPGFLPWRSGAAEAWLRLGNHGEAKRLLFEQMSRPGVDGSRARALALRVLAMTGKADRRPQLLTEAVDILESCGDRFELARVLADLGRVRHHLGDHKRARMMLRRAWHLAKACGAAPLRRELMPEPAADDVVVAQRADSTGIGSLTGSERRVAGLAVAGYSNREIARKLFITDSTVEQHLTRVYRKLNIKYRRDLPTELHADMATSA